MQPVQIMQPIMQAVPRDDLEKGVQNGFRQRRYTTGRTYAVLDNQTTHAKLLALLLELTRRGLACIALGLSVSSKGCQHARHSYQTP